jgi:Zn-dependent protease
MNQAFLNWSLPVGSIFGIRVRIHWILLVLWALRFHDYFSRHGTGRLEALGHWLLDVGLLFGIILLHELGHCFAARRVGGSAESILLWPLGGLAALNVPQHWYPNLIATIGGPLVNVLIAMIAFPAFFVLDAIGPAWSQSHWVDTVRWVLLYANTYLLLFNLVPIYPLDGGRIFFDLAWRHEELKGGAGIGPYYRAALRTVFVTRVFLVLIVLYALYTRNLWMIFIALWCFQSTELFRYSVAHGGGEESTYGHDFSEGYTSLERGWSKSERSRGQPRRPGFFERLKARFSEPKVITIEDARRVDEILEKIAREGEASLTRGERRFLSKMSRRRFRK